jgi:KipI family sensor histidine kinase inhibitor
MSGPFRIVHAGDSVAIVEFADRIDERINAQAIFVAGRVERAALAGVRDVVPTFRSVAVYFDPLRTDYDVLHRLLSHAAAEQVADGPGANGRSNALVRIPVRYGGEHGPDLRDVAAFAGLTEAEVIERHATPVYRVFMMGFVPGFPYMGSVDPAIAAPRRSTPRVRVPAGSVGIAGSQTGIYPSETPGGWRLIGHTDLRLFDLSRPEPFLLKPGDAVEFYPVH